jgi:hypothetical protein
LESTAAGDQNNDRLHITHSVQEAFIQSDMAVFTPTAEYGGLNPIFNSLVIESTLWEAFPYLAHGNVMIQAAVPIGFSEKLGREYGMKNITHSTFVHSRKMPAARLIMGGGAALARNHARLLQSTFGVRFKGHLVEPRVSEAVALIIDMVDLNAPDAIVAVRGFAKKFHLDQSTLIKCLGLVYVVEEIQIERAVCDRSICSTSAMNAKLQNPGSQ